MGEGALRDGTRPRHKASSSHFETTTVWSGATRASARGQEKGPAERHPLADPLSRRMASGGVAVYLTNALTLMQLLVQYLENFAFCRPLGSRTAVWFTRIGEHPPMAPTNLPSAGALLPVAPGCPQRGKGRVSCKRHHEVSCKRHHFTLAASEG